jgi:hypothetical protein
MVFSLREFGNRSRARLLSEVIFIFKASTNVLKTGPELEPTRPLGHDFNGSIGSIAVEPYVK